GLLRLMPLSLSFRPTGSWPISTASLGIASSNSSLLPSSNGDWLSPTGVSSKSLLESGRVGPAPSSFGGRGAMPDSVSSNGDVAVGGACVHQLDVAVAVLILRARGAGRLRGDAALLPAAAGLGRLGAGRAALTGGPGRAGRVGRVHHLGLVGVVHVEVDGAAL